MSPAKLQFSAKESELVTNTDWILTKNNIIKKIITGFDLLYGQYKTIIDSKKETIPPAIFSSGYKISRGENYRGLPWVTLDSPRLFGKEDVFAIRTMFWWGNFFSITLHLSGKWREQLANKLIENIPKLEQNGFSISVSDDQWHHHFEKNNYVSLQTAGREMVTETISNNPFVKLAKNYPIHQWDTTFVFLENDFKMLLDLAVY